MTGEILQPIFNELDKDVKAEVIAAEMVEYGTDADRILIMMLGALKRPFSKDVEAVEEELSEYDHKEYMVVKTPREGIYDMLPQGLFHRPTVHKAGSEKELIKTIQQRRVEESQARKFFLPFEASINYLRMQMALHENRLDKRSHYNDLVDIFSPHWEIFRYLDNRQAGIFLHLLPILHDIRDNHTAIQSVMEMLFLLPVQVGMRSQAPLQPADPILSKVGGNSLGIDLTTGNALYEEGMDEIVVKIGPMQPEIFREFAPGATNQVILQWLIDYLLPVHLDVATELVLGEKDKMMRLEDEASSFNAVLGSDTYL